MEESTILYRNTWLHIEQGLYTRTCIYLSLLAGICKRKAVKRSANARNQIIFSILAFGKTDSRSSNGGGNVLNPGNEIGIRK